MNKWSNSRTILIRKVEKKTCWWILMIHIDNNYA